MKLESEFSAKEEEALKMFRERLIAEEVELPKDKLENDDHLIQWLRVKSLDVGKAMTMLKASLAWRRERDFDNLANEAVDPEYKKTLPYYIDGEDLDGRTIISYSCGRWDIPKMIEIGERDKLYRYSIQMFARLEEEVRRKHRERGDKGETNVPYDVVYVVDVEGSSLRQLMSYRTIELILELTGQFESNFPDFVNRAYFINASKIFTLIFKLMKPFLASRTLSNIQIFDSNEKNWKPIILSGINANQLRPTFGGTKKTD